MDLVDQLKKDYISWLKEKVVFTDLASKAIEITTPFLNSNQDYVQIYAVKDGDNLLLTDDGDTLNELYLAGFDLTSPKRKEILEGIIRNYGVSLDASGSLMIRTTMDQFPQRKHALLQAMLKVNDMLFLNRRTVKNIFLEDVKNFLWDNDVRFTPNISLVGKSGYPQNIDIVIPASNKAGERFVQAINNIDKTQVHSTLFIWDDIRTSRSKESSLYVFVNDSIKSLKSDHISAFEKYEVKVVPWESRKSVIKALTA